MSTQFMLVQLYEIQTPAEAEALIALGVDHIGSVILSASRWKDAAIRETVRLTLSAGARSSLIPLFNTPATVMEMLDYYRPDIVHFCESVSDPNGMLEICRKLLILQRQVKKNFPEIAIMRSIPIAPPGFARHVPTLELAALFEPASDYFLTDTLLIQNTSKTGPVDQPVNGFIGITGRTCDWLMARKLVDAVRIPVILAGGISPDNVVEGLRQVRPAGVDSCTGTNAHDRDGHPIRFKKDPARVKRLVDAVREFEAGLLSDDLRPGSRRPPANGDNEKGRHL
jgi:phosphoribosylanthranilate isomerase